ncbi:Matrixin [Pseudobythopirellula maris]|uniref:Matrixin n=1 Tax=Pseudobythopirellula maris TaxID=2527991 RepID=A0A5C5ZGC6_9BACT|nr:matrixin family metalloprotease [Pseudobythopirellula maris]TWT86479.1 Matrixin [Pseudobythopirellula maris]
MPTRCFIFALAALCCALMVGDAAACAFCGRAGDCLFDSAGAGQEEAGSEAGDNYAEFQIFRRWTYTATDGGSAGPTGSRGEPVTVTWRVIDDGTPITGVLPADPEREFEGEQDSPSNLVAMLDGVFGASATGQQADAPWFSYIERSFDRWAAVSGLTFVHELADGGAAIDSTNAPYGRPGRYADVRIGGHSIDGSSGANTLAYNYFPDHSDMVVDTDNVAFFSNDFGDYRRLRNTLMHEIGHGLGLGHVSAAGSAALMEPTLGVTFDGPQYDDVLAVQRLYGDAFEKDGGNDTPATAVDAGEFQRGESWAIGLDGDVSFAAGQPFFTAEHTDLVSVDDISDLDYYHLRVLEPVLLTANLKPVGPTYQESAVDETAEPFDASELGDLELALYEDLSSAIVSVAASDTVGLGLTERLRRIELAPGTDYYVRVRSQTANVQMYRLDLMFQAVPEPASAWLLAAAVVCGFRGSRAQRAPLDARRSAVP